MSTMCVNCGLTKPPGTTRVSMCTQNSREMGQKSGCGSQFVGSLDVGHNIRGLPNSAGFNRLQADCPVSTPACTGHADDVELHVPAQRMPLQGVGHTPPDFVECGRRFF